MVIGFTDPEIRIHTLDFNKAFDSGNKWDVFAHAKTIDGSLKNTLSGERRHTRSGYNTPLDLCG